MIVLVSAEMAAMPPVGVVQDAVGIQRAHQKLLAKLLPEHGLSKGELRMYATVLLNYGQVSSSSGHAVTEGDKKGNVLDLDMT